MAKGKVLYKSKYLMFKPGQKRINCGLVHILSKNNHKLLIMAKEVLFLDVILDEQIFWKAHISHVL